jgi:hypothetical protein
LAFGASKDKANSLVSEMKLAACAPFCILIAPIVKDIAWQTNFEHRRKLVWLTQPNLYPGTNPS